MCLEVLTDQVRVQVPQIFSTEVIPIYNFAGPRPVAGDEGWVEFENGMAEFPVWAGTESGVAGPPGPQGPAGATGPTGPQGPTGLPPTASYWWSNFSGPSTISTGFPTLTIPTPYNAQGFHKSSDNLGVLCDVAGTYRVGVHLSQNGAAAVSGYTDMHLDVIRGGLLFSSTSIVGSGLATSTLWLAADGEVILTLAVGDLVRVQAGVDVAHPLDFGRSYISIIPVGGAQGAPGPPGVAVGTTAWVAVPFSAGWSSTAGYAPCMYRLEGDRVWLRGGCTRSPTAFTAGGSSIATFPAGFRPPVGALSFILQVYGGGVRTDLGADGSFVMQQDYKIGTPQSLAYVNLDGVSWSITA